VQLNRFIVVVPVVGGLLLAGTAMARMQPAETIRDAVYPVCQHNGVHFNKQGHANCGLHKGWTDAGEEASRHGRPDITTRESQTTPQAREKHQPRDKQKHEKHHTTGRKADHVTGSNGHDSHGKQGKHDHGSSK
jgi:hypothetical protein